MYKDLKRFNMQKAIPFPKDFDDHRSFVEYYFNNYDREKSFVDNDIYTTHLSAKTLEKLKNKDKVYIKDLHDIGITDKGIAESAETMPELYAAFQRLSKLDDRNNYARVRNVKTNTISPADPLHRVAIEYAKSIVPHANIKYVGYMHFGYKSLLGWHIDYPRRQYCNLVIPLYDSSRKLKPSSAITYYETHEYQIDQPYVLNIMEPHGVKDVLSERLMLNLEINNIEFSELAAYLIKTYPDFYKNFDING